MAIPLATKHRFREGETDAIRRYRIEHSVSGVIVAKDLTGVTAVKLYATRQDGTNVGPITGSIVSPNTSGLVDVDHVLVAATAGTYYCELELTAAAGASYCEEVFLTPVRKKASDMDV